VVDEGFVRAETRGLGSGDDHLATAGRAIWGAKDAVGDTLGAAGEGVLSLLPGVTPGAGPGSADTKPQQGPPADDAPKPEPQNIM
jgi:hypothetical protein